MQQQGAHNPPVMLQEQLRAERLLAEEKQLTFRPVINQYSHSSRPRLRLSNPEPYLAHVQSRAMRRAESSQRMKAAAEVSGGQHIGGLSQGLGIHIKIYYVNSAFMLQLCMVTC